MVSIHEISIDEDFIGLCIGSTAASQLYREEINHDEWARGSGRSQGKSENLEISLK